MLRRVTLGLLLTLMGVLFPCLQIFGQEDNIWISPQEIYQLPTEGAAWNSLKSEADKSTGSPNLSNQNDNTNVRVMAKALMFVRTGTERYRQDVIEACMDAIGTESGGRTLALGRELMAYVIAAGLVGLPAEEDENFRDWLSDVLDKNLQGKTLRSTHRERPNNWGRVCGASRAAVAVYLGNNNELAECAAIFRGWLGDRNAYNDFKYGSDLSWQADPDKPVGINPLGAYKNGRSIDGVLPEEMRRSGSFTWPPPSENYVYEALQGAVAMAVILSRNGYPDVWNWEDKALLRAFHWLYYQADFPADGDDGWLPHLINFYYNGANFYAPVPATPGKNAGWADWTHGERDVVEQVYLTLNTSGNGSASAQPSGGIYNIGETVDLSADAGNGYIFSHWSGDAGGNNSSTSIVMNEDKAVTAHFIPEENYSLTVHSDGGGTVTIDPPGGFYSPGSNITLTAEPFPGYIFTGWQNDLGGAANPASLVMNEDKIVIANFEEQVAGNGPIVHYETKNGGASGTQVSTAGSLENVSGHVYYAAITMKKLEAVTSVSGLGLTWRREASQCAGRLQTGVEIWSAWGDGGTNGKVTAEFDGNVSNAAISVSRYSGVSTSSPLVGILQGNSNGLNGQCGNGTDNNQYNFTTYNTIDSLFIFSAIAHRNRRHSPGPGFTERVHMHQGGGGSTAGLSVMDRCISGTTTVSVNGTFNSSVDWAVIGLLLRPASNSFQPEQYTLTTIESGNGDVLLNPDGGVYDEGTAVEVYAEANVGSVFDHWEGDLNGTANPADLVMDSDKTVTAVFTDLPEYDLNVEIVGNGNVSADPSNGPYLTGTTVTLTATAQEGYEFSGWSGDLSGTSNQTTITMDSDKSVTATFLEVIQPEYSLAVNIAGNGTVSVNPDQNTYPAGTEVILTATPQDGYEFSGWSGDISATANQTAITMDSDKSVTATFTEVIPPSYNLTVEIVGNGIVDVSPAAGPYPAGTEVILTATPQEGYAFSSWSGDLSGNENSATVIMDSDKTIIATFTLIQGQTFTLTTSATGAGSITLDPEGGTYNEGTVVTLTAEPQAGYEFSGWDGHLSGNANPATLIMDSDKSVTATFTEVIPEVYNLTVETTGNGTVDVTPDLSVYPAGTTIILTATAQEGYEFSGWNGDLSGNANPASLVMNSDKIVNAVFTEIPPTQYDLTVQISGEGEVVLDPAGGTYDEGTVVTLTATPDEGYTFLRWAGDLSGTSSTAQITMDAHKTVGAVFEPIQVTNITREAVQLGSSTNSSSVSTGSNLTAVDEDVYLATVSMNKYQIVSRVDGLGLNWELVKEICSGRSNSGVSVWVGRGTASQNGRVTARLQSRAESAVIAVVRYSGVSQDYPIGERIGVNTNGINGSCLNGGATSSFENTINTPVENCVIFNAVAVRHRVLTPGNGYEKIVESYHGSGGSTTGLAIQERLIENSGTATVDATLDNIVDWAHVALVLIPNNSLEGATLGGKDMNLNNDDNLRVLPKTIQLLQNYPNPFNGETTIQYALPEQMTVQLKIYDTAGREVLTLVNESQDAGIYSYRWQGQAYNGLPVSSGFYFIRLSAGTSHQVKKMIYQK